MAEIESAQGGERQPVGIIVCYTKCWPCNFGSHDAGWHTWADHEDVTHAAATGQADPSDQRCGCWCCAEAAR